jgi:hypothetical protein
MMRTLPVPLFHVPTLVGSLVGRLCAPFAIASGTDSGVRT